MDKHTPTPGRKVGYAVLVSVNFDAYCPGVEYSDLSDLKRQMEKYAMRYRECSEPMHVRAITSRLADSETLLDVVFE